MQLQGKVALVTGGAHRVGKAIALALADQGAHVMIHYGTNAEAARQTVAEIGARGVRALSCAADLREPAQIEALFAEIEAAFGHLDVLVNSAANFIQRPFEDTTVDDWKDVMQTNLRAPFLCTQHAARLMRRVQRPAEQPAAIVNIADLSGLHYAPGYIAHGLSKAGVIHLTRLTALELAPDIRVNAVAPGPVMPPPGVDEQSERWQQHAQRLPLRRTGNAQHVAAAVVFLAQHDYITGALIPVDGGEHLMGAR